MDLDPEEIYQIDRNNNMKMNKLRNIIKNKEKNIKLDAPSLDLIAILLFGP